MIRDKLMQIQTKIKAPKNLYNSFGKYSYRNAEGICEAIKPFLADLSCSLVLEDEIVEVGGRIYVKATATLMDNEGDSISVSAFARESFEKKGMDDSQITGAASSYARKYALNGLFLLDDTKDADSEEYHVQQTKADVPKTNEEAKDKCSDKQVKFIETLISKKGMNKDEILSKYKDASSLADLSKAQAKALIDYLSRE